MLFEPFEEVTSGLWVICSSLSPAAAPELSASVGPLLGHLPLERLLLVPGTQGGGGRAPEQRAPSSLGRLVVGQERAGLITNVLSGSKEFINILPPCIEPTPPPDLLLVLQQSY